MADGRWLSWAYHVGEEGFPFFSRHRGPDQPPEDNERTERGQEMGRLGQLSSVGELALSGWALCWREVCCGAPPSGLH